MPHKRRRNLIILRPWTLKSQNARIPKLGPFLNSHSFLLFFCLTTFQPGLHLTSKVLLRGFCSRKGKTFLWRVIEGIRCPSSISHQIWRLTTCIKLFLTLSLVLEPSPGRDSDNILISSVQHSLASCSRGLSKVLALTGRAPEWQSLWVAEPLSGRAPEWQSPWVAEPPSGRDPEWQSPWVAEPPSGRAPEWQSPWVAEPLSGRASEWQSLWVAEPLSGRASEWQSPCA